MRRGSSPGSGNPGAHHASPGGRGRGQSNPGGGNGSPAPTDSTPSPSPSREAALRRRPAVAGRRARLPRLRAARPPRPRASRASRRASRRASPRSRAARRPGWRRARRAPAGPGEEAEPFERLHTEAGLASKLGAMAHAHAHGRGVGRREQARGTPEALAARRVANRRRMLAAAAINGGMFAVGVPAALSPARWPCWRTRAMCSPISRQSRSPCLPRGSPRGRPVRAAPSATSARRSSRPSSTA